jgi:two-component system, response regulator YesN
LKDSPLNKAIGVAESYSAAIGVDCRVLGRDGSVAWPANAAAGGCSFCRLVRGLDPSHVVECGAIHRYGVYQAERFGGQYIYFCSASLLHWAVPIVAFGETVAALIGGPVLLVEPDDIMADEIGPRYGFSGETLDRVRSALGELRLVPPSQATAFSDVLRGLAAGISASAIPDAVAAGNEDESRDSDSMPPFEFGSRVAAYPLAKERSLVDCVSRGDQDGARVIMNDLLGHLFFSSGKRMDVVRSRLQELAVLLSRAAIEGGASEEEIFGLNNVYLKQLQSVRSFEDMAFLLAKITRRFSDCVFDLQAIKHADVMRKALRYFNAHYSEKIGLESVADEVHLSPSYFSRLFKGEMKMNFSTYLNELRIERSKVLLDDRSISLVEIAGRVGFEDQSYFTKVFKKVTGLSPGAYRESRGSKG